MSRDNLAIQTLRVLAMEEITNASSGHPGIALGAASIIHALYHDILKINPKDPTWFNRDRFILSAGHGSSLLYAALHLAGFDISINDLKDFRKIGSITPGHPELLTPGVDAQTGPLGQGIAMGVGMAIGEAYLVKKFNKPDLDIIDHYTYVLCGDGDLQEGIAQEAISLAGHLQLKKLIIIYDSNDIQLDGKVAYTNTEDVRSKYMAMNYHYERVEDGENLNDIILKIEKAKQINKPSIIEVKTIIGATSSLAGTSDVHGAPLKSSEVENMRRLLTGNAFDIPSDVLQYYNEKLQTRLAEYKKEQEDLAKYQKLYPQLYSQYYNMINDNYSFDLSNLTFPSDYNLATRATGGQIIKEIAKQNPMIIGGAADLTKSTGAKCDDVNFGSVTPNGRNICFGVREHAMGAICNGLYLHRGFRPFCSGFLVFCDYMKPAIRLSALMEIPVVYIFTHDSIAVGEDGPTHQPIEQITLLRSIPNLNVIRPASAKETKQAYEIAFSEKHRPTAIILTRQAIKEIASEDTAVFKGAYIISKEQQTARCVLLATGSEVSLAMEVQAKLLSEGLDIRVVSMPSVNLFDQQPEQYKNAILPGNLTIVALEASDAIHLYKYTNKVINITEFGVSGKASKVLEKYGFTTDIVASKVKQYLK